MATTTTRTSITPNSWSRSERLQARGPTAPATILTACTERLNREPTVGTAAAQVTLVTSSAAWGAGIWLLDCASATTAPAAILRCENPYGESATTNCVDGGLEFLPGRMITCPEVRCGSALNVWKTRPSFDRV